MLVTLHDSLLFQATQPFAKRSFLLLASFRQAVAIDLIFHRRGYLSLHLHTTCPSLCQQYSQFLTRITLQVHQRPSLCRSAFWSSSTNREFALQWHSDPYTHQHFCRCRG